MQLSLAEIFATEEFTNISKLAFQQIDSKLGDRKIGRWTTGRRSIGRQLNWAIVSWAFNSSQIATLVGTIPGYIPGRVRLHKIRSGVGGSIAILALESCRK